MSQVPQISYPKRRRNMHPGTHKRLLIVHKKAQLPFNNFPQTVGNAAQSAGYHAADGHFQNERGEREAYCAAFDESIRNPHHLTGEQLDRLLRMALQQQIVMFWRSTSQGFQSPHIHGIDCHLAMKPELRSQVAEFCYGGDGLVGDNTDPFWLPYLKQASFKLWVNAIIGAMEKSNGRHWR